MLGPSKAVQGNLDPAALFAPPARSSSATSMRCSQEPGPRPGTSSISATASGRRPIPDAVARLVDYVHEVTSGRPP